MLQISDLHGQAKARLQTLSGDPKRLALIHTAIALGTSFLLTVVTYLFSLWIDDTGGLGGMGLRTSLSTAQSVLEVLVLFGLPIWQLGIYYVALQWTKGENPGFSSLLQGFRRFSSGMGTIFLRSALFVVLGIAILYFSTTVFMMTPFAAPLIELFAPMIEQGITPEQMETLVTPELTEATMEAFVPLFIIFAILYVLVAIPLFYRLRFADFAVMDGLSAGRALLKSFTMTQRRFWQLLKLDLSFWWFYLLQLLTVAVCYADSILPALGVTLPVSSVVAAFGFYAIGSVCQCVLLWQFEARRVTVYGLAYRTLDGTIDSSDADPLP